MPAIMLQFGTISIRALVGPYNLPVAAFLTFDKQNVPQLFLMLLEGLFLRLPQITVLSS
jgi:hypothetical protein